ncbi:MAG: response regulator transcription factor [bacterium]|nr:response regulator transcription factor [bacterium]
MRLLLVEDEKELAKPLKEGLEYQKYAVDLAFDGQDGERLARENNYDVIILDIMLPQKDGISITKSLRADGISTPILMLTAKGTVEDKTVGLDAGADDYLPKPFAFGELSARVRALLRRAGTEKKPVLQVADLQLDPATHDVIRAGKDIELVKKDFQLLEYLMRNADRVLTRAEIEEHVWDRNAELWSDVIRSHIKTLRAKIDKGHKTKLIKTIHGVGYKISAK